MNKVCALLLFCLIVVTASGQRIGVKTNLLYDATATINLGAEVKLGGKYTLDISGNYNGWTFSDDRQWKHWMVQPEARYWLCEKFNGHFFGLHGLGGQFNVSAIELPFSLYPSIKESNYRGDFYGGGLSYGYQWILGRRLGLEASIGGGYMFVKYNKYADLESSVGTGNHKKNYWGLTKAGISIIYFIN